MSQQKVVVYTDGGARGNPGPSGIGVSIQDTEGKVLKEFSKFLGKATNNFAEYQAVIEALELLKKMHGAKTKELEVQVRMDSELVCKQLKGEYRVKEPTLYAQYMKVHNLQISGFPDITFTYIPREKNKEADRLANEAMDRGK